MKTRLIPVLLTLASSTVCTAGPEENEAVTPAQEEFFETRIRPLLAQKCWSCHGSKKQEGGLRLDSLGAATRGGDSGPAVAPGRLTDSLLIEAIEYENFEMPPDGKLRDSEIAALKRWIQTGAPWPGSSTDTSAASGSPAALQAQKAIQQAAKNHWAFQPVVKPPVPDDEQQGRGHSAIDRFVWRKLREHNLQPSAPAERRVLLRRAFFDLIGMPPDPAETNQFLSDKSDQAFAKLVDRLLDDPRYGERWGRHWLDVARYADSKGAIFGEPREYPFAYTYRDYVITSFNDDKPFDLFLREQLAADQLTENETDPSLAALGFLTVHRRANGGGKEAQWADRVDTVTRGMLGLTVACARCHDHKYDPIPTADFYSLFGVFASIEEPDELPVIGRPQKGSQLERQYLAFVAEEDRKREQFITTTHQKILSQVRSQTGEYLLAVHDAEDLEDGQLRVLAGRRKLNPHITLRWKAYLDAHPHDAVFGAWQALAALPGDTFATDAPEVLRRIAADSLPDCRLNPHVSAAFAGKTVSSLEDAASVYQQLFDTIGTQWEELTARSGADNRPASFDDPQREELRQCLYGENAPAMMPAGNFKLLDRKAYLELLRVEADRRLRLALHAGSPRRAMVVRDTQPLYQPYVFLRGNKDRRGPAVARRFLEILSGPDRKPFQHGAGRRDLAEAITAPDNPLTARVIVNRVWLWHFGTGLVTTPSDFGLRADPPSHPQLLDWLAAVFVEDGWSLKTLHRRIMNSATYQQSSHGDSAKFAIDPDNRLLWRFNRRRLDYEAIHDSMLAVAGRLDPTRGGPAVQMIRDAGWEKVSSNQTNRPFNPWRRAVYGVVDRDRLPPLLPTFDFASPDESSATRDITTVPTQSLYLMNSDFVMELAAALANRDDVRRLVDPARRVQRIYELAFNRSPTDRELTAAIRFLHADTDSRAAHSSQPPASSSAWHFGYAGYDPKTGSHDLSSIRTFPFHGKSVMQGSKVYPDRQNGYGWLKLTPAGGHAAGGNRCLVRRWTSPVTGTVTLSGTLKHAAEQGNGIQATIYGPEGRLGRWSAHHSVTATDTGPVQIRKGQTIDFVIDSRADGSYDGFQWAPVVKLADGSATWPSENAFPAPQPSGTSRGSDVWARYCQVLLMSNEFVFIE